MIRNALKPHIEKLLQERGPMTTHQLADFLDCTPNAAGYVMRHSCFFHISGWTKTGRAIWSYGCADNVPRGKKPKVKDCPKLGAQRKTESLMRERERLNANYIKGERIQWGGLCL